MNAITSKTGRAGVALGLAGSLLLGACANMDETQQNTAKGAGIGAAAGAVLGGVIGGRNGAATGAALGGIGGAVGGNIWSRRMEERRAQMAQATQGTGIEVARTQDNQLKLDVPSDISFDTGRADLKPQLRTVLDKFAGSLGQDRSVALRIIGHTDSTGTDAINDRLSIERANSVRNYLSDRGVAPGRIETAGRGSHEPIADNSTEAGRAKNRRVEIFLREPEAPPA